MITKKTAIVIIKYIPFIITLFNYEQLIDEMKDGTLNMKNMIYGA